MDGRRLDTGQILAAGVLEARSPVTDIPSDREVLDVDAWESLNLQSLIDAVEAGQLLTCCEYYGIAYAWKDGKRYRGTLLQYRVVSENPTFEIADELISWLSDLVLSIRG